MLQSKVLTRMVRGFRAGQSIRCALSAPYNRNFSTALRSITVYPSFHQSSLLINDSRSVLGSGRPFLFQSRQLSTETAGEKNKSSTEKEESKAAEDKESGDKPGASEVPKGKTDAELLKERITSLESELNETRDHLLRALAETENVRSRTAREVDHARTYAIQKFAKELLDVADNLHRAVACVSEEDRKTAAESSKTLLALYEGVEMTSKELAKAFHNNKIEEFGKVGDAFDPHTHEAMFQVNDPSKPANTIAQVLKTGYKFKDRVLRPAQVGTVSAASK